MADEAEVLAQGQGAELAPDGGNVDQILRDYHRKQLVIHLIGPIISLCVHILAVTGISVLVQGKSVTYSQPVEVTIQEVETVDIEEDVIQEIEKDIEEVEVVSEAPAIDVVAAPTDAAVSEVAAETISDAAPAAESEGLSAMEFAASPLAANTTPLVMPGLMGSRATAASRAKAMHSYGGNDASADAVERALQWLQSVQKADGSWDGGAAHTGLALLTFLARGETPLSPKYGYTVQQAMQWLSNHVMALPANGMAGGNVYAHGIATYALCESYAMTRIPFLRGAMEKSLDRIIRGQQSGGGFNYGYDKGARWDVSVGGWQVQAMKAGIAAGATNPGLAEAAEKAMEWLRRDTYANGKFGYSDKPGTGGNMTGVGAVCLQLLGDTKSREVRASVETIATERLALYQQFLPNGKDFEREAISHVYGWYYDTQAMFNVQGKYWKEWNKVFQKVLVKAQNSAGYWDFREERGHYGTGTPRRVLVTCWCTLQLEVYYRYLPSFDLSKMMKAPAAPSAASSLLGDSKLIIE